MSSNIQKYSRYHLSKDYKIKMFLKEINLKNFRGYNSDHRIPVDQLTAFVGKNDAGKSSIFDALAIFFDHPLGKIDSSDVCVHAGNSCEVRIGCIFTDVPEEITIDATSKTSLKEEFLLNSDDNLEIHKVYNYSEGSLKKPKIFAIANHPTANIVEGLLTKKNPELKKIAGKMSIDNYVDMRSNVALRRAIWNKCDDLKLQTVEIPLEKEDAKTIWKQLFKYLPEYALFRSDRPSTIDIFADPRVAMVVLGGSTLQEWVNHHYLKNLRLPEIHIYDRDEPNPNNGSYKYQDACDKVNARGDNSLAFLTQKREMENYIHMDAINEVFYPLLNQNFTFTLTDDCDVENQIKSALNGQGKIQRRSIKHWLNEDAADKMTIDRLKERAGYDEVKQWFEEIAKRVN